MMSNVGKEFFSRLKELKEKIVPTQETIFRVDDEKLFVVCKRDRLPKGCKKPQYTGECFLYEERLEGWAQKEAKKVENIFDADEIRRKFNLSATPQMIEIKRDYNSIKQGVKIGVKVLCVFYPKLCSIVEIGEPVADMFSN